MKLTNEIYNVLRSKFRLKIILSIALICILIFPIVILENQELPTSNENLFYLGSLDGNSFIGTRNSTQTTWSYMLLNHNLQQVENTSITGYASIEVSNKSVPGSFYLYMHNVSSRTNDMGIANFSVDYLKNLVDSSTGNNNSVIENFYLYNFTLPSSAMYGNAKAKYNVFSFKSKVLNQFSENASIIYFTSLPSRVLGYYGMTPVFYSCAEHSNTTTLISYKMYNPQNKDAHYKIVNLTVLNDRQIYVVTNYGMLKQFNEANNVSFYANGIHETGSLFQENSLFQLLGGNIITTGFGSLTTEIALFVSLIMTLILFVPMYNNNVYRRYFSLPETRTRTGIVQISSALIASSIFTGIALGASLILSYLFLNLILTPFAMLFTYLIIESAFLVFASIYMLLSSYFPGRNGPRMFLTVFLIIGYPIISGIGSSTILLSGLFHIQVINSTYIYKPILSSIRNYNIIASLLPVLNVMQFNNYLLRAPFEGVIMYNHLNLFDLSPIIFISSIVGLSLLFIYLSIRKMEKT